MSKILERLGLSDSQESYEDDFVYFWDDIDETEYIQAESKTFSEWLDENLVLLLHLLLLLPILTMVTYISTIEIWIGMITGVIATAVVFLSFLIVRNRYVVPLTILSNNLERMKDNDLSGTDELLYSLETEILSDFNSIRSGYTSLLRDYQLNNESLVKEIDLLHAMITSIYRGLDQTSLSMENTVASTATYQETRGYLTRLSEGVDRFTANFDEALLVIDEISNTLKSIGKQTTMLALNAGIEAAKAGKSGRGFEVVANNLRRLAQHAIDTANRVEVSSERISEIAKDSLEEITSGTTQIENMIDSNHTSTAELNSELYNSVNDLNAVRAEYTKISSILNRNQEELRRFKF